MKSSENKRRSSIVRPQRRRSYSYKKKRSGIGIVRKWLMRHSYAPAICLGIVILASVAAVCVFALPVPKTAISTSDSIATAQTEAPASESSDTEDEELYEDLQTDPVIDENSSVLYDADEESSQNVTVYAAEDAECYHLGDCKFAFASSKRLTPYEAYYLGYRPCGRCNPPVYNPLTGKTE